MTDAHDIDLPAVLAERLTSAHPDVLRELLATFIHTLMGQRPTRCAGPAMANAALSAPTNATAIGSAGSTPGRAVWI
ncbi:hypothetical protein MKOR_26520 [Mycolicibacillus koreensis]|nr:hypothetical protein MKOR_26520 [Mycolicibacillus koreensis]